MVKRAIIGWNELTDKSYRVKIKIQKVANRQSGYPNLLRNNRVLWAKSGRLFFYVLIIMVL